MFHRHSKQECSPAFFRLSTNSLHLRCAQTDDNVHFFCVPQTSQSCQATQKTGYSLRAVDRVHTNHVVGPLRNVTKMILETIHQSINFWPVTLRHCGAAKKFGGCSGAPLLHCRIIRIHVCNWSIQSLLRTLHQSLGSAVKDRSEATLVPKPTKPSSTTHGNKGRHIFLSTQPGPRNPFCRARLWSLRKSQER